MKRMDKLFPFALAVTLMVAACVPAENPTRSPGEATAPSNSAVELDEKKTTVVETQDSSVSQDDKTTPEALPTPTEGKTGDEQYRIITLLPRDAIPAIDNPQFLNADQADQEYEPDEEVIGVVFDGQARAYSIPLLSRHEIVNDTVSGHPIAVTW
jgi:hypothetical protein